MPHLFKDCFDECSCFLFQTKSPLMIFFRWKKAKWARNTSLRSTAIKNTVGKLWMFIYSIIPIFFHLNDDNKKRQIKWYFRPWYGTSLQNFVKIILKKSNHFVFQIAFHSWYKPCDFLQVFLENNNLATGVVSMTKGSRRRRRPGQCPNSSSKLDRIWLLSELMHPLYLQSTNQIVR